MTRGTYTPWQSNLPPAPLNATEIKFDVGKTCHGQTVQLIAAKRANGKMVYALRKNAVDQRDDTVTIFNLEPETMDMIVQAVGVIKRLDTPSR